MPNLTDASPVGGDPELEIAHVTGLLQYQVGSWLDFSADGWRPPSLGFDSRKDREPELTSNHETVAPSNCRHVGGHTQPPDATPGRLDAMEVQNNPRGCDRSAEAYQSPT